MTFNRVASVGGPPTGSINLRDLGVNIYQPPGPKTLDNFSVSGFFSLSYFPPAYWYRNTYGIADDVSWVHGRHNIAFGGTISKGQTIMRDNYLYSGRLAFTNDYTNYALASLMLGKVRTFAQGAGENKDNHNWFPGVYLQDDIHVSRRLTVNLGVRYEPYLVWQEQWNRYEQFRPADYYAGTRSQVYTNAPPGLFFYGDKGVPAGGARSDYRTVAPRVGFAWDVTGDGKTSLRGGGGFFYDAQQIGELNNRFVDIDPFSPQISLTDPRGSFSNPYLGVTNPFPAVFPPPKNAPFPALVLGVTYDPSHQSLFTAPVIYNWNFTVERQLASTWMARLAYVGSRSVHLTETVELNPAVYTPGNNAGTDARRIFAGYASIGQGTQDINAIYHSLQATLQHRFSHGFQILANYTWSKSLDDVPYGQGLSGIASQNVSAIPWYLPGRHNFDYGRSDFDRTHNFVLSYTWDLPTLQGQNRLLRAGAGGWQVTGILTAQSGSPVTVLAGTDASRTGLSSDRGQLVSNQIFGPGACGNTAPCVDYLNRAAFTTPATGTFGNIGKGSFSGPSFLGWDLGAFKTFALGSERLRLQFRGEFFNVPNHTNLGNPNAQVTSGGFGSIRGASDPRIGQLALKLLF